MKVTVLKREKNELKIEIKGEGHSFCNALQEVILRDGAVEAAGYDLPHPLVAQPIMYVRTKKQRKPERILMNAAKELGVEAEEFRKAFAKALKRTTKR